MFAARTAATCGRRAGGARAACSSACTFEGEPAERTLVVFKPDSLQRALLGELLSRFERRGFKAVGMKLLQPSRTLTDQHYDEHRDKPFFDKASGFLSSGPVVASVWEARGAIAAARAMVGATEPLESPLGTIRADYGVHWRRNLVHSSACAVSARREIDLWFRPEELVPWAQSHAGWLYELPGTTPERPAG